MIAVPVGWVDSVGDRASEVRAPEERLSRRRDPPSKEASTKISTSNTTNSGRGPKNAPKGGRGRDSGPRVNEGIKAQRVLVIAPDGAPIGEHSLKEALYLAGELELDLVEVAPGANPPVVKITDYGKMRYEKSVKEREARKHRAKPVKTLQFRPVIADGDYNTKLRQLRKFLEEGHKVAITVRLRGRENATPEVGFAILRRIETDTAEVAKVDQAPNREGRQISMRLSPAA